MTANGVAYRCQVCRCPIEPYGTYDWRCQGKHDRPMCTMRGCVPDQVPHPRPDRNIR